MLARVSLAGLHKTVISFWCELFSERLKQITHALSAA